MRMMRRVALLKRGGRKWDAPGERCAGCWRSVLAEGGAARRWRTDVTMILLPSAASAGCGCGGGGGGGGGGEVAQGSGGLLLQRSNRYAVQKIPTIAHTASTRRQQASLVCKATAEFIFRTKIMLS